MAAADLQAHCNLTAMSGAGFSAIMIVPVPSLGTIVPQDQPRVAGTTGAGGTGWRSTLCGMIIPQIATVVTSPGLPNRVCTLRIAERVVECTRDLLDLAAVTTGFGAPGGGSSFPDGPTHHS